MKVIKEIIFKDLDNPESGHLIWDGNYLIKICDKDFNEIDRFYSCKMLDLKSAQKEAQKHFSEILRTKP